MRKRAFLVRWRYFSVYCCMVEFGQESQLDPSQQESPNLLKRVPYDSGNQAQTNPKEETISV